MEKVTTVRNQLQSCAKKTHKENKILINKVTACGSITSRNKQVCFYRPQRSWGKVMFFTRVCKSVHGGVCPIACWDRPPSPQQQTPPQKKTPPESRPPSTVHAGRYGQQAGGTHPTGMQSCLFYCYFFLVLARQYVTNGDQHHELFSAAITMHSTLTAQTRN